MQQIWKTKGLILLKGMAMGTADVIPGVSGGTIAFITGIYDRLLSSINKINVALLKNWWQTTISKGIKNGIVYVWHEVNASFLITLGVGIGVSVWSLSPLMLFLMTTYPYSLGLWAFFMGLILISSLFILKDERFSGVNKDKVVSVLCLLIGIGIGFYITVARSLQMPNDWYFTMLAGFIAISAMILPGISGSFLLLLMGKYQVIIEAIHQINISVLIVFGLGAVVGLLTFARLIAWLLQKAHRLIVSFLAGLMLGSLNKLWPWQKVVETYIETDGITQPLASVNLSPWAYKNFYNASSQMGLVIISLLLGLALPIVLNLIKNHFLATSTS